ncbi:MAG TPA: metallophosphoesterase family protein [Bacteroidota bacterium]|nr:metallophosphoesterase family protein [Bacteroidota bacterium]
MESKIFVFGDIHGCYLTFRTLFEKCKIQKQDSIYLLGDYIDRGPRSKQTLDFIFNIILEGYNVYPVKGNHEQMLLDTLISEENEYSWRYINGGEMTLLSFKVKNAKEIPSIYLNWIGSLPFYYELEKYVIVHAGLNLHKDNPFEDTDAMIWTRDRYYDKSKFSKKIIIGHTPTPLDIIEASLRENIIFLDGGCVYAYNPLLGNLCALELSEMRLYVQHYLG